MRSLSMALVVTLVTASGSVAQGRREIALPDTAGANFPIADTATKSGTPSDYDTLLGFWHFRFQPRNADGSFASSFTGHWSFEKKPGGLLIEDRWRVDDPSSSMGNSLYTYRLFDPERKIWQMLGARSTGGEFEPGLTWSDASSRYAIQHNETAIVRIRYLAIKPDKFLWRADRSTDGGKTWLRDAMMMEASPIGR